MVSRTDVSQEWVTDPRISTVAAPATSFDAQDIVDTLRLFEERFRGQTEDKLLNATGKDQLSPSESTVITASLQNNVVEFEARYTPAETGTATSSTSPQARGVIELIDTNADFVATNVQPGSFLVNWDDRSVTDVRRVLSPTVLECKLLQLGTDNDFDITDAYSVWNITQCELAGGNVIAVDEFDVNISAVLPSAFTQVVTTRSTAGAVANLTDIELQLANIHGQVQRCVYLDTTAAENGDGYQQSPFNNTADALTYLQTNGLRSLVLMEDATMDRDLVGFQISGVGAPTLTLNGFLFNKSEFTGLILSGAAGVDGAPFKATDCTLADGISGLWGTFRDCEIGGTFDVASSAVTTRKTVFQGCYSGLGGAGQRVELRANGGAAGADISMRAFRGGLNVALVSNANDAVTVGFDDGGKCTLLASCTDGDVSVRGNTQLTDNSAGSTVDTEALIRSQVWRALVADYNTVTGSFGEYMGKKLLTLVQFLGLK